uniref:C-type lectin domain-containing protein n=1 Tax=Hucho hucho TaxID=62062 RepID=A0A4W5MCH4_9TELE
TQNALIGRNETGDSDEWTTVISVSVETLKGHDSGTWLGSCLYYISDRTESWDESRQNCLKRGELICTFKKSFWIGLTDRETKVTWKWVDGTLMTTGYWSPGEPNGATINSTGLEQRHWICEK